MLKRLISVVLCFCMLGTLVLDISAAGAEGTITMEGETQLILPGDGMTARVKYDIKYFEGAEEIDGDLMFKTDTDTVSVDAEGYVYLTSQSKNFTLTAWHAANPEIQRSLSVTVSEGYHDDFDSSSAENLPLHWKNGISLVEDGKGGNAVYLSSGSSQLEYTGDTMSPITGIQTTSFRYYFQWLGSKGSPVFEPCFTSGWNYYLNMSIKTTGEAFYLCNNDAAGAVSEPICEVKGNEWIDFQFTLDYTRKVADVYVNGEQVANDLPFLDTKIRSYKKLFFDGGKRIDDFMVFSGEGAYQAPEITVDGADSIELTPGGDTVSETYTVLNNGVSVGAVFSVLPADQGVTMTEDGVLSATIDAEGSYLIRAELEDGSVVRKQIQIQKTAIAIEGENTITLGSNVKHPIYKRYASEGNDVYFTIQSESDKVTISQGGILKVEADAPEGNYIITAALKSDPRFKVEQVVEVVRSSENMEHIYVENETLYVVGASNSGYPVQMSFAVDFDTTNWQESRFGVPTDAEGGGSYDLSTLESGFYHIQSESNYTCFVKDTTALLEMDKTSNVFYALLSDAYGISYEQSQLMQESYSELEDTEQVDTLAEGDPERFSAAVLLVGILEDSQADATVGAMLQKELENLGIDGDPIALLMGVYNYEKTIEAIQDMDLSTLEKAVESIEEASILKGVQYLANYRDAKKYLVLCGNSKYDDADNTEQDTIAKVVAGNEYASLDALDRAINKVNLSGNTSGGVSMVGGGGSGGSSGGAGGFGGGSSTVTDVGTFETKPEPEKEPEKEPEQPLYQDVPSDHWGSSYIQAMTEKGIVSGYDGYFYPEGEVTRAEFVKMLCNAAGITEKPMDCFEDVPVTAWYYGFIGSAYAQGLIQGDGENFHPEDSITREDASVMLHRFFRERIKTAEKEVTFTDAALIADYAKTAVQDLTSAGIINGFEDNSFRPQETATRAEAVKMIYGILAL